MSVLQIPPEQIDKTDRPVKSADDQFRPGDDEHGGEQEGDECRQHGGVTGRNTGLVFDLVVFAVVEAVEIGDKGEDEGEEFFEEG